LRIANRYADCMAQFVTRIDERLAEAVDELVSAGVVSSRSEAVRLGLAELVDRYRRNRVGRQIADAYLRIPQGDREIGWADEATRRMIADEPW